MTPPKTERVLRDLLWRFRAGEATADEQAWISTALAEDQRVMWLYLEFMAGPPNTWREAGTCRNAFSYAAGSKTRVLT